MAGMREASAAGKRGASMRIGLSLLAAGLMTTVITVMLISAHPRDAAPVMRHISTVTPEAGKRLTNGTLVDFVVATPLDTKLKRANWTASTLSLDFVLPSSRVLDDHNVSQMLHDVEAVIRLAFLELENVNRVLIRFGESPQADAEAGLYANPENESSYRLLMASDVRRTDRWIAEEQSKWVGMGSADSDSLWKSRLRLSFTPLWEMKRNAAFMAGQEQSDSADGE
ncbi:hypothetical protein [Paenibacillus sp. MMS18-CY102]|uniref:hypothetical protein n=1 Tax=Paenibacillus sp. MMS18-CY102 TaxID=2682849 RepID=UPI0013664EFB|nr:hypothetical protein [Paenibacillus sp. MMS18-CY102]MWC28463.1 hypothetical protein [Paenibacillus sp. MMS18-CY102]